MLGAVEGGRFRGGRDRLHRGGQGHRQDRSHFRTRQGGEEDSQEGSSPTGEAELRVVQRKISDSGVLGLILREGKNTNFSNKWRVKDKTSKAAIAII